MKPQLSNERHLLSHCARFPSQPLKRGGSWGAQQPRPRVVHSWAPLRTYRKLCTPLLPDEPQSLGPALRREQSASAPCTVHHLDRPLCQPWSMKPQLANVLHFCLHWLRSPSQPFQIEGTLVAQQPLPCVSHVPELAGAGAGVATAGASGGGMKFGGFRKEYLPLPISTTPRVFLKNLPWHWKTVCSSMAPDAQTFTSPAQFWVQGPLGAKAPILSSLAHSAALGTVEKTGSVLTAAGQMQAPVDPEQGLGHSPGFWPSQNALTLFLDPTCPRTVPSGSSSTVLVLK
mmetsp:Transcript_78021/g.241871  ORF Transcript_78021/g.241871 Transcript_78021/m.241871 type:complete len:287 (-) Transcript_78021:2172-3032(-)